MNRLFVVVLFSMWTTLALSNLETPVLFNINTSAPVVAENIMINGQAVKIKDNQIFARTLNTLYPNILYIGDSRQEIEIDAIAPDVIIPIELRYTDKTIKYYLNTMPADMPKTSVQNPGNIDGYITTSFHALTLNEPSYAVILDTKGNIIYYMGTDNKQTNIFHLQRWDFTDKTLYSYHIQTDSPTTGAFLLGDNVVMDDKFNEIDRVRILATERHPEMAADQHDFVILGDKHYLVISYWYEVPDNATSEDAGFLSAIVQEQKDGQVIFDWVSSDYKKLFDICIENCPEIKNTTKDYIHINSVAVDPADNNLILSLASPHSVIKINRTSGDIIWTLSGLGDDFNVEPEYQLTRQHDAHIENGELVIFDNNYSTASKIPQIRNKRKEARIARFKLDETNKQILKAVSIPLNITTPYMGSAQEVSSDRYFVGCGNASTCAAKMQDTDGQNLFIMTVDKPYTTYRAYFHKDIK